MHARDSSVCVNYGGRKERSTSIRGWVIGVSGTATKQCIIHKTLQIALPSATELNVTLNKLLHADRSGARMKYSHNATVQEQNTRGHTLTVS